MVVLKEIGSEGTGPVNKMFWGVTLDAGKRYSQVVKQSFQLTMAALEHNQGSNKQFVQLMLQHESQEYLLCTLQHGVLLQQRLDLVFMAGESVSFSLNGSGVVHLTGFLNPENDSDFDDDDINDPDFTMEEAENSSEGEESSEEEDVPDLVLSEASVKGKRKATPPMSAAKRLKMLNYSTGDDDDEDDDDDDDEEEEEEDFSDDFEDSDFEDEEEEEMEEESPVKKGASPTKKGKEATPKSAKKKEKETPIKEKEKSTPKKANTPKNQGKTPQPSDNSSGPETPSTPANGESAKKKKKNKKKKKKNANDGEENTSKVDEAGDTPKASTPDKPGKKRVVAGGTVVEDVKVGHGPEAKPGKMVSVYYVGTLAKNKKRFDSCQHGKPFRFKLNKGEVIKGWDNGLNGMKVGGKRKLLIPASQAYGNSGSGPIPSNAALEFEIELKAVS